LKDDKQRIISMAIFLFVLLLFLANIPGLYVDIDEAWLGEQAHFLSQDGIVRSEMFDGFLHYDERILVYHKGFILAGAVFLKIFGFGLFSLRIVSLLSLAFIFILMFRICRRYYDTITFLCSAVIFLLCPLIFRNSILYRPELLVALLGLLSFTCLKIFLDWGNNRWLIISGLMAGLAAFSHLNGLIFIGAGGAVLAYRRQWSKLIIFGVASFAISMFYFYDVPGHWELFKYQFSNDPSNAGENAALYKPVLNLLNEHKRLFRKPEIICITTLFAISLIQSLRDKRRFNYDFIIYSLAAVLFMGLLNHNKTTKYAILYFPYFALLAADNIRHLWNNPRLIRCPLQILFMLILGASTVVGLEFAGRLLLTGKENLEEINRAVCAHIPENSRVLAPIQIMFNEIDNYRILGLHPARLLLKYDGQPFTLENLCGLAREKDVKYIIIDSEYRKQLGCNGNDFSCFKCPGFEPLAVVDYHQIFVRTPPANGN